MTQLPENWNKMVADLKGPFLQSREWAEFQQALGREIVFDSGDGWAWLGALRKGRGGVYYLYCSYGPVVAQNGLAEALDSLQRAAKARNCDFVRIEPWGQVSPDELKAAGYREMADSNPKYYMELKLTPDLETIRKGVSQSNRNLINQTEARGLSFRISDNPADVGVFNQIHNATAEHGGFANHGDAYYQTFINTLNKQGIGKLYFADHAGEAVAAALCYDWNGTRYYAFAGADPTKNRELKAAVALVWWLIADAKEKGLTRFNYGGVAPENEPNHPYAGHSRFKRSIGGETIETVGTWEKPLKPLKYQAYLAAKKVLGREL